MADIGFTYGIAMIGMRGFPVTVEAHLSAGLPSFQLVGLPDTSLKEAKQRVEAAISSSCCPRKAGHLTVNLAPADVPKTGSGFDLAIAVAVLSTVNTQVAKYAAKSVFIAELGLDGSLLPVNGVLSQVLCAREYGLKRVIVCPDNEGEARLVPDIEILSAPNLDYLLTQLIRIKTDKKQQFKVGEPKKVGFTKTRGALLTQNSPAKRNDMADVKGLGKAKKALEIAAAGGHNLLLIGVPGCGKTMLASCLPSILPELTEEESLEVSAIHSLSGAFIGKNELLRVPPFIAPHHSTSLAALIGGGSNLARPGAISMAHRGVLFLDEATEFAPRTLDAMRQPIESGFVSIHRAKAAITYPCRFQLIMAANPCPCGKGVEDVSCSCSSYQRRRYLSRLSGPLLDRIDLHCEIKGTEIDLLTDGGESSDQVRERVVAARKRARHRWRRFGWKSNSEADVREMKKLINSEFQRLVEESVLCGDWSLRVADRMVRVGFTLADLQGKNSPGAEEFYIAREYHELRR